MSSDPRLLLLLGLAGCGALVDANWLGTPMLTLEGTIYAEALEEIPPESLRVAIFWDRDGGPGTEQVVGTSTSFPARYAMDLYEPPPAAAMIELDGPDGVVRLALGRPMLYADIDGDGAWTEQQDPLMGGSAETVIVFADAASYAGIEFASTFIDGELTDGFQLMSSVGDPCVDETFIVRADQKQQTDLVLSNIWSYRWDLECEFDHEEDHPEMPQDGQAEDGECPDPYSMIYICREEAFLDDPTMRDCFDEYCPTINEMWVRWELAEQCYQPDLWYEVCYDDAMAQNWQPQCIDLFCPVLEATQGEFDLWECGDISEVYLWCLEGNWADADPYMSYCMELFCP